MLLQALSSPRCRDWNELRTRSGVRQLGVHLQRPLRGLGKALRVTSNSEPVIEAMLKRNIEDEIEDSVQKGCELETVKKIVNRKDLCNLQDPDALHIDQNAECFIDDTLACYLTPKRVLKAGNENLFRNGSIRVCEERVGGSKQIRQSRWRSMGRCPERAPG